jgi:hypothetical protein
MQTINITKEINNWQYSANVDLSQNKMNLNIIPKENIPIPDILVKYYRLNSYNVDAITHNYLYASHPFELNDPFDCFSKLIASNNIPLEMCIRFMNLFQMPEEKVTELYSSQKNQLFKTIESLFYDYTYSKIGIISMTSDPISMQMWTYYCDHKGFQIAFKTSNLKSQLHGPFPINYVKESSSIDFTENVFIAALFQSNIKSNSWVKENEWRFLFESIDPLKLPNKKELWDKQIDRKFNYDKSDIEEVVLGFLFFDNDHIIDYLKDVITYDFSLCKNKDELTILLDYLIENSDLKVSLIYMYNDLEFKLCKRQIEIQKIRDNVYSYKRLE